MCLPHTNKTVWKFRGGEMSEEIFIIRCMFPFFALGVYHFFKWVCHMDKKNGVTFGEEKP